MGELILSHVQVADVLAAKAQGATAVDTSLDLNLSTTTIPLTETGIVLPDGQTLTWAQLDEIMANELACYTIADNQIEKVQFFSDTFNRFYSLMPTEKAPTMLISGIPMHRVKNTNPHKDTLSKIKTLGSVTGHILDTTMGLGYTVIQAAKTATAVTTIELDPTVLDVCHCNPWSQGLFDNPKITRLIGDAHDVVETFDEAQYAAIVHDPPMFSLAGHLYSAEFYRECYRVLKGNGRLFHYIGDPKSKSGGSVTKGVMRRLKEVGFRRIKPAPQAFGVVAYK